MHCNNQLSSHFLHPNSDQNHLICLVLTDFPPNTNLILTKSLIEEDYPFINKIHVPNGFEIQCFFQSMTDLIEIDQGKKYAAGRAFIRDHAQKSQQSTLTSDFQKPQGVFQNSSQTFASETHIEVPSYKFIPQLQSEPNKTQKTDIKHIHRPIRERLTSLEVEVEQLEHLRGQLCLIGDEIDWEKTGVTHFISDESAYEKLTGSADVNFQQKVNKELAEINQNGQKEEQESCFQHQDKQSGKQMVFSLIEGAALTGIIYGGFKILKNIIG